MWNRITAVLLITFAFFYWAHAGEISIDVDVITGKWLLKTVDGAPVARDQTAYFSIAGNELSGFDGCNFFGGTLENPALLRMTQRACADDQLAFDANALVAKLPSATLQNDTLTIVLDDTDLTLLFLRDN
ncbi:MAG: META domain-containing protein [Roseibium sp.]